MKKKILFAVILTSMCMSMTACGNPLKLLPEANEDVNIYDADEKSTGNEAADAIIKSLKKGDAIAKKVSEFYVEERSDKDSKERSELTVCVVSEDSDASFEKHFDVTMKYDEDDKSWSVKDYEEDKKAATVNPKKGVDEETLIHDISIYASRPTFGENSLYVSDDNCEVKIEKEKIGFDKELGRATDSIEATVTIDGGLCVYETKIDGEYVYCDHGNGKFLWDYGTLTWSDDYTEEYSESFKNFFTPENMIGFVGERDVYIMNDYYTLSPDMFDTYTFGEFEIDGGDVSVPLSAHFANSRFMDVTLNLTMKFYTYSGQYEFGYFDGTPELVVDYSKMEGESYGDVRDKYDNTKQLGSIHFMIDSADSTKLTGTLKYEGNDGSVQEIAFTGEEYASWGEQVPGTVSLTLDEEIVWEKYSRADTIYLSFDPDTGNVVSDKTYAAYFQLNRYGIE